MRLTRLLPDDVPTLHRWAHAFLVDHLRWWTDAAELGWTDVDIDGHLVAMGLVERDVRRLREASRSWRDHLVAVARIGVRLRGDAAGTTDT